MDPHTEKLLERTRQRREMLNQKIGLAPEAVPRKRRSPLEETTNVTKNSTNGPEQQKEDSPKRTCVREDEIRVKPDTPAIVGVRSRMSQLSQIHASWSQGEENDGSIMPVPVPRHREPSPPTENHSISVPTSTRSRFKQLAQNINDWEDDLSHPRIQPQEERKAKWQPPASDKVGQQHTPTKDRSELTSHSNGKSPAPEPPTSAKKDFDTQKSEIKLTVIPSSPSKTVRAPLPPSVSSLQTPRCERRLTDQIPVNAKGLNESPHEIEEHEEPTEKPVSDRFQKWAQKIETPQAKKVDPAEESVGTKMAVWEQRVTTPRSENKPTVTRVNLPPKQMCSSVDSSFTTPQPSKTERKIEDPASLPVSSRMASWQKRVADTQKPKEEEPTAYSVSARMSAWETMSSSNKVSYIKKVDPSSPDKPPVPKSISTPSLNSPKPKLPSKPNLTAQKSFKDSIAEKAQQMSARQSPMKSPCRPVADSPSKMKMNASPVRSPAKVAAAHSPNKVSVTMKLAQQKIMDGQPTSTSSMAEKIRQERMAELKSVQNRWQNGILSYDDTKKNCTDVEQPSTADEKNEGSSKKDKKEAIKAIVRADFDRKLASMGFDLSEGPTPNSPVRSFSFKKDENQPENNIQRKRFISGQEQTNSKPRQRFTSGEQPISQLPPRPPQLTKPANQMLPAENSESITTKPPVAPKFGPSPQKPGGGSLYKIVSSLNKKNTPPEPKNVMRSESYKKVQFEDSFDSIDDRELFPSKTMVQKDKNAEVNEMDTDTSANESLDDCSQEAEETKDSTYSDNHSVDEKGQFQNKHDDYDGSDVVTDSEEEFNSDHEFLDKQFDFGDDGDDVSLAAFVSSDVRRESILPKAPDHGHIEESLDRHQHRYVDHQSTGSLTSQTSTESDASSLYREERRSRYCYNDDTEDDTSAGAINDLLDEAMDEEEEEVVLRHPKRGPVAAPRKRQCTSLDLDEDYESQNNPYTIKSYRSSRECAPLVPPSMKIVRNSAYAGIDVEEEDVKMPTSPMVQHNPASIKERIKELQDLVIQEQNVIMQTSNALNQCCSSNSYFAGSTEQVECNRLLLLACQKRVAYITEIDRLKKTGQLEPPVTGPKGSLTISDLRLPMKKEFVQKIGTGQDNTVHYFIILIRNGVQILVTQMLSTHDPKMKGSLDFPNLIKVNGITGNFKLTLEIYGMSISKEAIGKDKSKKRKTPKKKTIAQSPGGPMAVRTTSFSLITTVTLTLKSIEKKSFTLERVPYLIPLHGTIYMQLKCLIEANIEERGFLTMFEDVSGLGAWHRRWCVLSGNKLCFWKYPDDERRKDPMGYIDLKRCITEKAGLISRDICARPNTFELVSVRQPRRGEQDTLVTKTYNTMTTMKHMLSADTKEERIIWCNKVNHALANLRTWHSDALRPVRPSVKSKS